ncbi:hypothetical protein IWX91DRAFT_186831 [Phyllosticta citricarpa]
MIFPSGRLSFLAFTYSQFFCTTFLCSRQPHLEGVRTQKNDEIFFFPFLPFPSPSPPPNGFFVPPRSCGQQGNQPTNQPKEYDDAVRDLVEAPDNVSRTTATYDSGYLHT